MFYFNHFVTISCTQRFFSNYNIVTVRLFVWSTLDI